MKDIGEELQRTMNKEKCNPFYAFIMLQKDVCILQSKPSQKVSRRLRDKSGVQSNKSRLGKDIY